jgi:hypothetical protein
MSAATHHLSTEALLAYWLQETDDAATDVVDEHLMQCEDCGERLDALIALGDGVRAALQAGAVSALAGPAFVQRLAASGLRLREYRLPHNGSVHCSVAPEDDLLVAHLEAPLQGVTRLDVVAQLSFEPGVQHRMQDIPFDPGEGELLYLPRVDRVRQLPAHTMLLTLLAVGAEGERELGRYTFHHQPH